MLKLIKPAQCWFFYARNLILRVIVKFVNLPISSCETETAKHEQPMGSNQWGQTRLKISQVKSLYFNSFSSELTLISSNKLKNLFSIEPDPFDNTVSLYFLNWLNKYIEKTSNKSYK